MRFLVCFLVGTGALSACSPGSEHQVVLTSRQTFEPATITVSAGETVSFTNASTEAHTVTAYQRGIPNGAGYFASGGAQSENAARDELARGLLRPQETFSVTLNVPGEYRYFCIPHEAAGMTGRIIVVRE